MPKSATKVTVSLPVELHREVERSRRAAGKSRSAVVQDALRRWLDARKTAALVAEYEAGYRRMPESRREVAAAEDAAIRLFASEEWE